MELYEKNGNILYILNVLKKYTDEEHLISIAWIANPFLDNFYKDTFLYSIGVK